MPRTSFRSHLGLVLTLTLLLTTSAVWAHGGGTPGQRSKIPAVGALVDHSLFFDPAGIYDFQTDPYVREHGKPPADLRYQAYSAVGYNLANSLLLVGPDGGLVVVDTLGNKNSVRNYLDAYRALRNLPAGAKLPIRAIIYTHNHIDHTGGVLEFLAQAENFPCPAQNGGIAADGVFHATPGCVEIISQKKVVDAVINTATVIGPILNTRSSYMYGSLCSHYKATPDGESVNLCVENNGIGPETQEVGAGFRMPTRVFSDSLQVEVAGLRLYLQYLPSETEDELVVFVPDDLNRTNPPSGVHPETTSWAAGRGLLFSAEVIQGPSFPNLYSLRGTSYRNPAQWFRSVDKLLEFDAWCMAPSHGPPVCGEDNIGLLLRNFRDAVQFTHDQTLRHMNMGQTPDELVERVVLPRYLIQDLRDLDPARADLEPLTTQYLERFYGSVPQAVREIYVGSLGWYEADPVDLRPTPPVALAQKTVALMNGAGAVNSAAQTALTKGLDAHAAGDSALAVEDLQWAAELTTLVVRAEKDSGAPGGVALCEHQEINCQGTDYCQARQIKAQAFLTLGEIAQNPNWRDWYISSAQELCGDYDGHPALTAGLVSPQIIAELPVGAWINSWTMRLKAEETRAVVDEHGTLERPGVEMALGFSVRHTEPGSVIAAYSTRFALDIRKAVAEFVPVDVAAMTPKGDAHQEAVWARAAAVVELDRAALLGLLQAFDLEVRGGGEPVFVDFLIQAIDQGSILLTKGTADDLRAFFGYFDNLPTRMPSLTLR